MDHKDIQRDIQKAVEKGIKAEKKKESLAVLMALGLVVFALFVGFTASPILGVIIIFPGLFGIWKYYEVVNKV